MLQTIWCAVGWHPTHGRLMRQVRNPEGLLDRWRVAWECPACLREIDESNLRPNVRIWRVLILQRPAALARSRIRRDAA
jgi:hypothetical protein